MYLEKRWRCKGAPFLGIPYPCDLTIRAKSIQGWWAMKGHTLLFENQVVRPVKKLWMALFLAPTSCEIAKPNHSFQNWNICGSFRWIKPNSGVLPGICFSTSARGNLSYIYWKVNKDCLHKSGMLSVVALFSKNLLHSFSLSSVKSSRFISCSLFWI